MKKQEITPSPFILLLIPVFILFFIMVSNFSSAEVLAETHPKIEYLRLPRLQDFVKAIF